MNNVVRHSAVVSLKSRMRDSKEKPILDSWPWAEEIEAKV